MVIKKAATFSQRAVGLMFKKNINYGLLLKPCKQIHTFFCREPLDIYYLTIDGVIIRSVYGLSPWKMGPFVSKAHMVLELPSGAKKFTKGDNVMGVLERGHV